jgi:2-oxoglutarate ferredoxin oxidoreductase subunit alpha
MRENFAIPLPGELPVIDRARPTVPPKDYKPFDFGRDDAAPLAPYGGEHVLHITSSMPAENGAASIDPDNAAKRIGQLHRKLAAHRGEIVSVRTYGVEDCEVLIIAAGIVARAARTAALEARQAGIKAGALQLVTIWPFADEEIIAAAHKAKTVIVAEMNYSGQLAGEVSKLLDKSIRLVNVNSYNGQYLFPQDILKVMQ